MLSIKEGVRLLGLKPEMALAIHVVESVYARYDYDCVLTSVVDGRHSSGSKHYVGHATDFRTRHLKTGDAQRIADDCKVALGASFDVVLETDHIHVEYDPKAPL